jgi:hypothetical protein
MNAKENNRRSYQESDRRIEKVENAACSGIYELARFGRG